MVNTSRLLLRWESGPANDCQGYVVSNCSFSGWLVSRMHIIYQCEVDVKCVPCSCSLNANSSSSCSSYFSLPFR